MTWVIYVFLSCLGFFVDLWGCVLFRCLGKSMVAWIGSQSEAGVNRCL